jgi:hypothetical protein
MATARGSVIVTRRFARHRPAPHGSRRRGLLKPAPSSLATEDAA